LGSVLNVEVPPTIKIVVSGRFRKFVGAKDLILHLIGKLTAQGANFKVLEFHGQTIRNLSTSGRLVLCNMSVEAGATAGLVPPDQETARYLREEAGVKGPIELLQPDRDAQYEQVIPIDVSKLEPQVACPHTVDNVKPVAAVAGTKIHQVVIGSCTNGRLDDLEVAATILKGRKVAAHTRMLVFPARAESTGRRWSKATWGCSSKRGRWS
jgi:3-isopropylmalate/(R)-2-methylmalate dehydratase large subunit